MLLRGRDQDVPEFINTFHTLCTKLGIKDTEWNLFLKYDDCLHKYIYEKMEFLDISSLEIEYQYVVKIEENLKQKNQDFGSVNPKQGKGAPKPHNKGPSQGHLTQENLVKLQ